MLTTRPLPTLLTLAASSSSSLASNCQAGQSTNVIKRFWRSCRAAQGPARAAVLHPISTPSSNSSFPGAPRKTSAFAALGHGRPSSQTTPLSTFNYRRRTAFLARLDVEDCVLQTPPATTQREVPPFVVTNFDSLTKTSFSPNGGRPTQSAPSSLAVHPATSSKPRTGIALQRTKAFRPTPRERTFSPFVPLKPSSPLPLRTPPVSPPAGSCLHSAINPTSLHSSTYFRKLALLNHTLFSLPSLRHLPLSQRLSAARAHGLRLIDSEEGYEKRLDTARGGKELSKTEQVAREKRWKQRIEARLEDFAATALSRSPGRRAACTTFTPSTLNRNQIRPCRDDLRTALLRSTISSADLAAFRRAQQPVQGRSTSLQASLLAFVMEQEKAEEEWASWEGW